MRQPAIVKANPFISLYSIATQIVRAAVVAGAFYRIFYVSFLEHTKPYS